MLFVNVVQDAEAVVRAKANFPLRREGGRLAKRLAILRFDAWLEPQLLLDLLADQAVVLGVDELQMLRHPARVDQGIGSPSRHDGYNSGHSSAACQSPSHEPQSESF